MPPILLFDRAAGLLAAARADIGVAEDLMEEVLIRPLPGLATGEVLDNGELEVARLEASFVGKRSLSCLRFAACDCVGSDLRGLEAILDVLRRCQRFEECCCAQDSDTHRFYLTENLN